MTGTKRSFKDRAWKFAKTTGLQLLGGGILGYFIGMGSFDNGFSLLAEYTVLPFYVNIVLVLLTYVAAIAVHELGHFFAFKRNGIEMRALFVMVFMFIKENGNWKFKLRPNRITAIGGIAIPNIDAVRDEGDLKKVQQAFSKALIAGPMASILFAIVSVVIVVPLMLVIEDTYLKSVLFTIASSIVAITLFVLITSFFKNEMVIGDFPAYKMARTDDFFVAMQFYQNAIFSDDFESVRSSNKYLKSVICEGLGSKLEEKDRHVYTLQIIDNLLVEYLAGVSEKLPEVIDQYVNFLLEQDEAFDMAKYSEQAMVLWFHIVRLLYVDRDEEDRAVELFEQLKKTIKKKTPVAKYMIKQTEHVLGMEDHSDYLQDQKNIRISFTDGLFGNFEGYYANEMRLNKS